MIRRRLPLRRRAVSRGPCLDGCGARAVTRGLCGQHYGALVRAVAKGTTTWEALEREGRCLPPAPSKHNARATYRDGIRFGSELEADYFSELQWRQRAGEIRDLQDHPRYELSCPGDAYTADATYVEVATGLRITADAKGGATKGGRFPGVCVRWRYYLDHPLIVVERRHGGFVETKRILPKPLPAGWRGHATQPARGAEDAA